MASIPAMPSFSQTTGKRTARKKNKQDYRNDFTENKELNEKYQLLGDPELIHLKNFII